MRLRGYQKEIDREGELEREKRERVSMEGRVLTHIRPPPRNVRPRTSKTSVCVVYSALGVGVGVQQC